MNDLLLLQVPEQLIHRLATEREHHSKPLLRHTHAMRRRGLSLAVPLEQIDEASCQPDPGRFQSHASARDWARFGLLYLRDGVTRNGRRILPEGWVDYSAKLTPQSVDEHDFEYGAGFWTVRGGSPAARARIAAGMPPDSFMANGAQGQYAIVIPSKDLVIVRIGWAYTPNDDLVAVERLVREVIAALQSET